MARCRPLPRANLFSPGVLLGIFAVLGWAEGVRSQPPPDAALPGPRLFVLSPPGARAGSVVEVTFAGADLEEPEKLLFSHPGIKAEPIVPPPPPPPDPKKPMPPAPKPAVTKFKVTVAADVPPGLYDARLVNLWGVSNPRAFAVGDLPEVQEKEPNNDVNEAQRVEINSTVNGAVNAPTDVDYYVFAGKRGQRVVLSCLASSIDSRCHPGLELYDSQGRQLATGRPHQGTDVLTDYTLPEDGDYFVRLFEFTHTQGSPEFFYRLTVTTAPWIDAVYPAVVEPGKTARVTVYGRNLPGGQPDPTAVVEERVLEKITLDVTAPADPAARERLAYTGHVDPPAALTDGFEFRVRNASGVSNPYLIAFARAPVVLDNEANDTPESAQQIPLPCEIAGRIEKRHDRDWYAFTARKGDAYNIEVISHRLGAPTYVSFMLYNPAAKQVLFESVDNPEAPIPEFFTQSDDPAVFRFVAPADGKYQLLVMSRVADTLAGPRHLYRVRISPDLPDYHLVVMAAAHSRPDSPALQQGGSQFLNVFAQRQDGFAGEIALSVEGLPAGVTCVPQNIGHGLNRGHLVLSAAAGAALATGEIRVKGSASIHGQPVVREARAAGIVWPIPPQQGFPTRSRLERGLPLAVRGKAPYELTAALEKTSLVQGDKANLNLKLARLWPDFKTPLVVLAQPQDWPAGLTVNNNQPFTINPDKSDGALPVQLAPTVQPGTYTLVLRSNSAIPYNKDPMAKQKQPVNFVQPTTPVTLTVLPKTLATVTLANPALTLKPGTEAPLVVRVARQFGYEGEFKLQAVLPATAKGVSATDAVLASGKDEANLVVKSAADAVPGNRPDLVLRVTAVYAGQPVVHEVKFSVNVVK